MLRSRALLLTVTLAAVAPGTGCDGIDAPIDPATGVPMLYPEGAASAPVNARSAALVQSESCEELRSAMRAKLIAEMISQVQESFASAWHMHEHCNDTAIHLSGMGMDAGAAAPTQSSPTSPAHSETNNQVAGVDEADIVKTDGNFIYLVSGGAFRILRSWPAPQTAEVAKVAIEGTPKKLFVYGSRALVYSALGPDTSSYGYGYGYGSSSSDCTYGYSCVPTGDGRPTKITVLDVSDRAAPKVLREITLSSSLLAARRVGATVHTVVTTASQSYDYTPTWPSNLDVCDATRREIYDAFRKLLLDNLETITLKTGLPQMEDVVQTAQGPQRFESPLADCRSYLRSSLGDGEQLTSVISMAMSSDAPAKAVTILSQPGVVYAAEGSLYLAEPRQRATDWGWYEGMEDAEATTLHKFALSNVKAEASYVASGLVQGRLLNQFSLDEHQGYLRVASTSGHLGWGSTSTATNRLSVFAQQGQALVPVGSVEGIGPGEDIRSVRFDGDRGYVVTFKKTDPLFVLDLADPVKPRVLGEAIIPGFSTYMQKLDATHLLTMGYDADDQGAFAWFAGVRLQIFDVANPLQPKLTFSHVIGTRGSSSEALTDHLAFTYYAPKNLLALPMTICDGGSGGGYGSSMTFSGLMLFNVTAAAGFSEKGRVAFPVGESASCSNWWTDASSEVKRSLIIENYVYSLTDHLLKVNELDNLSPDVANLPLDQ